MKIKGIHLMFIYSLVILFLGIATNMNNAVDLNRFLKMGIPILIVVNFSIYACYKLYKHEVYEDEQERLKQEAEDEETYNLYLNNDRIVERYKTTPEPIPSKYGCNFVVTTERVGEIDRSEALKEAVNNFKVEKDKKEKKEPFKPAEEKPIPIVEEGKSKAEKEGNIIIGSDGKATVKPNYKMIASEWVSNNLDLLNKICNDAYAISGNASSYSATIPAEFLPEEKATWIIIGKTLVAEDDISSFNIGKDGLEVTVD